MNVQFDPAKLMPNANAVGSSAKDGGLFGLNYRDHMKRSLDIFAILLAAPVVVPAMLLLVAALSLTGGRAFYVQERLGRGGQRFRMWKLRTMVVDAEARLEAHLQSHPAARAEWDRSQKLARDPRITPMGRLLRRTSLDELPQLWNVLRGDMSLIGPRPMLPEQRSLYPGLAYFRLRPGLTGVWQVSGRHTTAFADRADFDQHYDETISARTDTAILLATVGVVLRATGS